MVACMKKFLCALGIAALLIAGCGKKPVVDTGRLQKAFKPAAPAQQTLVEKVAVAMKEKNYPSAMAALQQLAHQPKITPEQQLAVRETMTAVQQLMTTAAPKPPVR